MRIWLDPQKLNKYNLVPSDVISQIKVQNNQISGGQLGGMPQAADQQLNASIIVQTRLQNAGRIWQNPVESSARWFASAAA